jgi:hypothetical protein
MQHIEVILNTTDLISTLCPHDGRKTQSYFSAFSQSSTHEGCTTLPRTAQGRWLRRTSTTFQCCQKIRDKRPSVSQKPSTKVVENPKALWYGQGACEGHLCPDNSVSIPWIGLPKLLGILRQSSKDFLVDPVLTCVTKKAIMKRSPWLTSFVSDRNRKRVSW